MINKENIKKSGGQILVDALIANGTKTIYCVPGESFLPVIDALYLSREKIQTVVCRHESGAGNMAEAYGKLTGEPGVFFVTRGPGATNGSIAVHTARQDSTPMILFIGQVERATLGREAWQEIDYKKMFGDIAKWVDQIDDVKRLPEMISRAYSIATSGRPGPVVLALPEDMLSELTDSVDLKRYQPSGAAPLDADIATAVQLIANSKNPIMILGGSGWDTASSDQISGFAERLNLPIACAFRRQDIVDNQHVNYVGEAGLGMNPKLTKRISEADLILCVGARLGETTTNGYTLLNIPRPTQKLIHVHADPLELGKIYQAQLSINATPKNFAAAVSSIEALNSGNTERISCLASAREDYLETLNPVASAEGANLSEIMKSLREMLPADSIITNGAGNYTLWVQRFYQYRGLRTQLAPTSGTMGYGLPAAIAAKLLYPSRTAVCFAGDGCFLMTGQELATAVQYGANIIVIVVNNNMYGSIRMHQERHYPGNVWATSLNNPHFVDLAKSYGAYAESISDAKDFEAAFKRALASNKPALIEVLTDPNALTPRLTVQDLRGASV
ncbi:MULTISPECIES: thiamine pyrophosphate-binding protein [unclassified Polynucleobacter]|uniref:thiamine pyrophosphate-binding protein n=1 Tax=unclassified Polynucleobacter TaxID=2640945 RepID=UPI0008CE72A7|nr:MULTISPECIES: thiamine pyrophosphate-binding protein [unclassified Polynucleobacter]OHC09304.1 MAG: thiamine pyrophosphate-binding protein [Polynucleobacter sp. GWA2_45_21]HBK44002.1 thiamine pyrophosphate-binding protein [Polynucleobacter sp.]